MSEDEMSPDFNINVLVVDDDAMVRAVICDYLQSFGFRNLQEAANGAEALKIVRDTRNRIDLILSDWQMSGIDGLMVLKATRSMSERRYTRFIMITSQTPHEKQKIGWARDWRVSSYIVKPFNGKLLREKIWQVFGWSLESKAG